jgi:BclB C-terminal domain-containing protein
MSLVGSVVLVQADLYAAAEGSNTFTPVPGTGVVLSPQLTGAINAGTTITGTVSGMSVPATAGSRLMLVFSSTAAGPSLINTVSGYYSSGLSIE